MTQTVQLAPAEPKLIDKKQELRNKLFKAFADNGNKKKEAQKMQVTDSLINGCGFIILARPTHTI